MIRLPKNGKGRMVFNKKKKNTTMNIYKEIYGQVPWYLGDDNVTRVNKIKGDRSYERFLKEIRTKKEKLKDNE